MSTRVRVFVRDNVIGLLALFVALSGSALALPGKNTVNSGDIKPQQVKASDLAANSVDSSKVVDNSLLNADIDTSKLGLLSDQVRFVFNEGNDNAGTQPGGIPDQVDVSCPSSERAIGGGGAWIIANFQDGDQPTALQDAYISASMPIPARPGTDFATGWRVAGRNVTNTNRHLRAYVVCVPKTPSP